MPKAAVYRLSHPEFLRLSPEWPQERSFFDGMSGQTYLTGELGHEVLTVLAGGDRPFGPEDIAEAIDPGGGVDAEFVEAVKAALLEFERLGLVSLAPS